MTASWETVKALRWRVGPGDLLPLCAGSGLARVFGGFWAVADDLNHLIRIPDADDPGRPSRLLRTWIKKFTA